MRKLFFRSTIFLFLIIGLGSCSGCVKKVAKKTTEVGLSAVEGVTDAVNEHGGRIAEKTTDAAATVAGGVGKSLSRQVDEHMESVAEATGKTLVKTISGLTEGVDAEIRSLYTPIPHTDNLCSGVYIDVFGRFKSKPVVSAYFGITEPGNYKAKFECYNNEGIMFLTKDADIIVTEGGGKTSSVSFSLNAAEEANFNNIKDVKITVIKE